MTASERKLKLFLNLHHEKSAFTEALAQEADYRSTRPDAEEYSEVCQI